MSRKTTRKNQRKIDALAEQMEQFIKEVHLDIPGLDVDRRSKRKLAKRCGHFGAVNSFASDPSETFSGLTLDPKEVNQAVQKLEPSGRTALFDSIITSIQYVDAKQSKAGRSAEPGVVITMTDGIENESDADLDDVRKVIKGLKFFPRRNDYLFVVGVGDDVNESQLKAICRGGYGAYLHADKMQELGGLFRRKVARQVVKSHAGTSLRVTQLSDRVRAELGSVYRKEKRLVPLTYCLNLDSSKSMRGKTR